MKLVELLKVHEECDLYHPIVGHVKWHESPIDGWVLVFAKGAEQWQILVADETVLFDDRWVPVLSVEEDAERKALVREHEEHPCEWAEYEGDSK